jgi:light-harvesting complex I chlorophyll a/b binding protein 1
LGACYRITSNEPFSLPLNLQGSTSALSERIDPSDPSIGVTAPLGVYDPLGWLDPAKDPASGFATFHANFERRRAVERKHGRVAMAAVVGMLFHNAGIEFPGYLSKEMGIRFSDIPDGMNGLFSVPLAGITQIFFFAGVCELAIWPASNYSGNYGTGYGRPFVPNFLEGDELKYKLDMEINQGRAAMMGIMGALVGEAVTGQTLAEQVASGNLIGYGPP